MAAPRRRRKPPATITTAPDPAKIGPLLRGFGFVGSEDDPASCRATFDAEGNPRSVKARYPGGWCCRLTLHRNGSYSLTQSISMTIWSSKRDASK